MRNSGPDQRVSDHRATRVLVGLALLGVWIFSTASSPSERLLQPERIVWGFEEGVKFRVPRGIALDSARDEVIVANTGAHRVELFSTGGRPLDRFVHRVRRPDGAQADGLPRAVVVDQKGRYLIADNLADYVDVLDRRGRSVDRITIPSGSGGAPTALHVTREGAVLLGGPVRDDRIHRFDASLQPLGSWGAAGTSPGELRNITAIATLPGGDIIVTCASTELAVQVFSPDGAFRFGFGRHDVGPGNFSLPSGVTTTDDGRIWVTDELRQIVQVFDAEGSYIGMIGGMGLAAGDFLYPSAIATNGTTRIAVLDREAGRFQVFSIPEGGEGPNPTSEDSDELASPIP